MLNWMISGKYSEKNLRELFFFFLELLDELLYLTEFDLCIDIVYVMWEDSVKKGGGRCPRKHNKQ